MYDVVALGECLIDFVPCGKSSRGNEIFEKNPGGAPANVLALLGKMNKKTAFIGKVGNDQFGDYLCDVLKSNNIDTNLVSVDKEVNTTLAFVHLQEDGDRDFSFYRNPGADINLRLEDIDMKILEKTKIFHFGSLSLTDNPVRETTFKALEAAKNNGAIVSYDPNLREALWSDLDTAKEMIVKGLKYANLVKVSEEELVFITGEKTIEEGADRLLNQNSNVDLLLVTLGSRGSYYKTRNLENYCKGYQVEAIDTTGAGDSFFGAMLYQLIEANKAIDALNNAMLDDMLNFANAAAAIVTTRYGAISSMPSKEEVLSFVSSK